MMRFARESGFTLFELALAVALSAALLVLVAGAINLYLLECDSDRLEVEQAQLVTSIVDMIAADLRAATQHRPQDLSQLKEAIVTAVATTQNESDLGSSSSQGSSQGGSQSTSSGTNSAGAAEERTPPGIYGNSEEIVIDRCQLPLPRDWLRKEDQQFAREDPIDIVSDLRTVRWFVREGEKAMSAGLAATSLRPEMQAKMGGLVRQEVDRELRMIEGGDPTAVLVELPGKLVAPEVVGMELQYFSGEEVLDRWDSKEADGLPFAVEVRLWIQPLAEIGDKSPSEQAEPVMVTRIVAIPMAGHGLENGTSTSTTDSSQNSSGAL